MKTTVLMTLMFALAGGCGQAEPTPSAPTIAAVTPAATVAAVKPDAERLRSHVRGDVAYPATRASLLATCADTPEFNAGEKQWLAEHLPEGTYENADQVLLALGV